MKDYILIKCMIICNLKNNILHYKINKILTRKLKNKILEFEKRMLDSFLFLFFVIAFCCINKILIIIKINK